MKEDFGEKKLLQFAGETEIENLGVGEVLELENLRNKRNVVELDLWKKNKQTRIKLARLKTTIFTNLITTFWQRLRNTKIRNKETVGATETGKTLDLKQYLSFQTEFKLEFDVWIKCKLRKETHHQNKTKHFNYHLLQ